MDKEGLIDLLPHGSGINADWYVTEKPDRWVASNSYHAMDEYGGYDGWADFTLNIPKSDPSGFKLQFNGKTAAYLNSKYGLRDYLEDTIVYALEKIPPETPVVEHKVVRKNRPKSHRKVAPSTSLRMMM